MSGSRPTVLSTLFGGAKSYKNVTKAIAQVPVPPSPLVKTVQAIDGILSAGTLVYNANETATNLNDFIPKASTMLDRIDAFVPSIQVMGRSFCDTLAILSTFNTIATTVGIGANIVLTYQGVQALHLIAATLKDVSTTLAAQTALIAQKDFPQYVYDMIRERVGQTSDDPAHEHWFFVWHPDNDWYPRFYHLLESKPLGPAFCGYTNQIDTAFSFMIAARRYTKERQRRASKQGRTCRPVMLHLLIPAYQPIVVVEALRIPEEIGEFVMEGRVNSNKAFVWMNLPEEQRRRYVVDIGYWEPPVRGWWDVVRATVGWGEQGVVLGAPRVLGMGQGVVGEVEGGQVGVGEMETVLGIEGKEAGEGDVGADGAEGVVGAVQQKDGREKEKRRQSATPLHQRKRRGPKKK